MQYSFLGQAQPTFEYSGKLAAETNKVKGKGISLVALNLHVMEALCLGFAGQYDNKADVNTVQEAQNVCLTDGQRVLQQTEKSGRGRVTTQEV